MREGYFQALATQAKCGRGEGGGERYAISLVVRFFEGSIMKKKDQCGAYPTLQKSLSWVKKGFSNVLETPRVERAVLFIAPSYMAFRVELI